MESNPYQPPADISEPTRVSGRRLAFISTGVGFSAGTAFHWIVFWTDTLSTEFPPMGGALLGLIVAVCFVFPAACQRRLFFCCGFLAGNVNAAFCRPLSVLNPFNGIPRSFLMSWGTATLVFAVTLLIGTMIIHRLRHWYVA